MVPSELGADGGACPLPKLEELGWEGRRAASRCVCDKWILVDRPLLGALGQDSRSKGWWRF